MEQIRQDCNNHVGYPVYQWTAQPNCGQAQLFTASNHLVIDPCSGWESTLPGASPNDTGGSQSQIEDEQNTSSIVRKDNGKSLESDLELSLPNLSYNEAGASSVANGLRCWSHGCNGRTFSSPENYRRHMREQSGLERRHICHLCGQEFSRKTARNAHVVNQRCKITFVDENGVQHRSSLFIR